MYRTSLFLQCFLQIDRCSCHGETLGLRVQATFGLTGGGDACCPKEDDSTLEHVCDQRPWNFLMVATIPIP